MNENLKTDIDKALILAEKTNYLNKDINYVKNVEITEWDIKSAGFSVLKFKKLLPQETLEEWEKLDKHSRTVKEGLLQKENKQIAEEIINTLAKVRKGFVLINKIPGYSILSIKKDAIFLINQKPEKTTIKDLFVFRKKGIYTSYINLSSKEFYYSSITNTLDVKGISDRSRTLQNNYFLKDLKTILRSSEKIDQETLFTMLKNYRRKYLKRELPIETYRDLETGLFRIGNYTLENASDDLINDLDISQNYINYLLPLFNILL